MAKEHDLGRIRQSGIVAILRSPKSELIVDACEALLAGGVEVMEVTFTVPAAHRVLEQVADRLGDRVLLGAGTVLDSETARIAMLAGAQFIVSPVTNIDVIRTCRRYDKVVMPGALTPTEVLTAWEAGADIVKIFPSDSTGPSYLKILAGPLPQVRMIPTGGVTTETVAAFFQAGAFAVGVGSALVEASALASGDLKRIEATARKFVTAVEQARAGLQR